MVSQLTISDAGSGQSSSVVRHPLLQTVAGTVQVFTAAHRSFFTNVMVQALRAAGQGTSVLVVQFLKGGIDQGPEHPTQLGQNLDWLRVDLPRCIHGPNISTAEQQALRRLWQHTQTLIRQGRYTLVVLDELSLGMAYGLIPEPEVLDMLRQRPAHVDIIFTGPQMPKSLLTIADQVTEFRRNFLP
ncbi:Cob(I)yrinic acid a,c-diamide adenosyltransferase [Halomicronema hongdechloris C2206]|uniref:Cob(I)yrinic acid a,c-diamide adenosyltransferase n=1 Tax=Halomicronema hongdechloris C2206 TaxID=1641165 RepID=A0A1Z3HHC2_9CYAN|nr:P-loop NTPase family protein [Halomicronema hongdechloris]ASC69607.1 Cob(I)yrinic acid a,c-diamide adenosyltransferase [Halomicronema hongdechloris C2206]